VPKQLEGLPDMKPEDQQYFGKLLKDVDESELSVEEAKERKIMKLLLKVKNGTPPQRKSALRQLTGGVGGWECWVRAGVCRQAYAAGLPRRFPSRPTELREQGHY